MGVPARANNETIITLIIRETKENVKLNQLARTVRTTIINEKSLLHAMSDAASHGGFKIRFSQSEETVTILTDEWLATMKTKIIPRKVIGLIAEYFGKVPEKGCYSVFRYKKEYEIQYYHDDTFRIDVKNLIRGEQIDALYTGMQIFNWYIFVARDGSLSGIKGEGLDLLEINLHPRAVPGKSLAYIDDDSALFLKAFDSTILTPVQQAIWGSLTAIEWWEMKGPEAKPAPEADAEQMELEERDGAEDGDDEHGN